MKRIILCFALLISVISSLHSLEAKDGVVKLVVNDFNCRVAFYRLTDAGRNKFEPLLFDQDSRTTFATLVVDGRYYRLGESPEFTFSASRYGAGVVITFRSSFCIVRQRISMVKSAGAAISDSFSVSFEIENTGQRDVRAGLRMLLDTWLGEKDGQHFLAGKSTKVTEETRIAGDSGISSITSAGNSISLKIMIAGVGITTPDQAVLANWKQLSDSNWLFEMSGMRGFSFAPFSVNDSAAALYWNPEILKRSATRKISFLMISRDRQSADDAEPAAAGTTETLPAPSPQCSPPPARFPND